MLPLPIQFILCTKSQLRVAMNEVSVLDPYLLGSSLCVFEQSVYFLSAWEPLEHKTGARFVGRAHRNSPRATTALRTCTQAHMSTDEHT